MGVGREPVIRRRLGAVANGPFRAVDDAEVVSADGEPVDAGNVRC